MVARSGPALPRRLGLLLATIPVAAVGLADAVIAVRTATPSHHAAHAPARHHRPSPEEVRTTALRALLDHRAQAILSRNEKEFLATVDPDQPTLVASQRREFGALRVVPFASWSFELATGQRRVAAPRAAAYDATTWAPQAVTVRYAISGFDTVPTSLTEYPTFVLRKGGWRIGSFDDFAATGAASDVDIWNFGPLRTARAPGVLVIGHPSAGVSLHELADEVSAVIPRVTAVWGRDWPRRVVVLVPASERELARVVGEKGDLSQIAAVASAEVQSCPGPPNPVGSRVGINPHNWGKLSTLGRRVVLTHELTHVATRSVTGSCMPTWLVEGFADYVGYLDSGVPTTVVAQELARDVRAGRVPTSLPADDEFIGGNRHLPQAYEGAWMAARLVVSRWSQETLVRLYRAVGTSGSPPAVAVARGMRSVLHVSVGGFTTLWRAYLRAELS